jgi:uncharacterized repeat protein (TIGR01451 family)
MNTLPLLRNVVTMACIVAAAPVLIGQTNSNSIQLFGPVDVRQSTNTASNSNPDIFSSSTVQLNCGSSPIKAALSSTPDGTGNVLVDNFINLTVTAPGSSDESTGPVDVCQGGYFASGYTSCFTTGYEIPASAGQLTGQDPDNFAATGGVSPIDISSYLLPGPVQAKIDLVDTGVLLASSSIYLNTNCTQAGITGTVTISGNPISSTNPTPQQLDQTFPFDTTPSQLIEYVYNLIPAEGAGELSITNGTIPIVSDQPVDPASFIPVWVPGTSFATSSCLAHTGELLPSGSSACALFTLECQVGAGSSPSGAQCPVSQVPNEIFQEIFDGPGFTLPNIVNVNGPTFHQGIGFLMASEGWTGGPCMFDPASGFGALLCPQNQLVSFTGPGAYTTTNHGTHPNSSFIAVAPVPEDLTTVTVAGQQPGGWINSDTASVSFSSQPPTFAGVQPPLPGQANFVPAPIQSITYGISLASNPAVPPTPIPGDVTLANSIPCPTSSSPTQPPATTFAPPQQSVPILDGDGMYLLHYYAQDCASTEELLFTQNSSGSWSTLFYTVPINVDTTPPVVATGPTLSPAPSTNYGVPNSYTVNQPVTATYTCTDSLSGVVACGSYTFSPGTLNTGNLTSTVGTSSAGTKTFTVNATDAAGNQANPASVTYTVVAAQPVNLVILKLAPDTVRHNDLFTYEIAAVNYGGYAASNVAITDALPAGVTFVSANAQLLSCGLRGCSYSSAGTQCSYASSSSTVTCTLPSLGTTGWFEINELNVEIVVRATAASGAKISNTATITSANPDPYPLTTQSTATTRVK